MIIQSYELPTDGVGFVGRLSLGERSEPTRLTLEELHKLSYEGSLRLGDYVRHFRPMVSVKVSCPVLVNGSVETKTREVHVPYGGAHLDPKAHVEDGFEELFRSFSAPSLVVSAADEDEYPMFGLALVVRAIDEIMDPNWIPAEEFDLERPDDRAQILETLASGNDVDVPPTELVLAPDNAAVPFDPSFVDGAFTSLDEAAVTEMYRETKFALLSAAPPEGSGYAEFLGDLRLKFRDALVAAIDTIREADAELARNWFVLAMIHSATPDAQPVRVLDVAGDWLIPANGKLTPIGGYARPENSSAQKEAFRSLVVPRDASDQSRAALRVVLPNPIEDMRTLKTIGEWAAEEKVIVFVNVAASSLDELARTADMMQNGTPEDWGKHVSVVGDWFHVCRGEGGSTLSIPAVAAVVGLQTVLDRRQPADEDVVTGIAVAGAGTKYKLLEFDGDARSIEKFVSRRQSRKIEALATDSTVQRATRGLISVPVPRNGGDGYGTSVANTLYREPKSNSPERVFENVAPVRTRNWVVSTIGNFLRHHLVGTSIDEKSLKELQNALQEWLQSLDERKGRRFINAAKSAITVKVLDGDRLHVDVKLVYRSIIKKYSVDAYASTDELTFEFDEEQGVWALSAAA